MNTPIPITAPLIALCATLALPASALTIEGITLGDPLPDTLDIDTSSISLLENTLGSTGGFFSDAATYVAINTVPGIALSAITDGDGGAVMAISITHFPATDGLLGDPDAVQVYPLANSALSLGETRLKDVLAAFDTQALESGDPLTHQNAFPAYRIARGDNAPALVLFSFTGSTSLLGATCLPLVDRGAPSCLEAALRSIYVIDTEFTPPFTHTVADGMIPIESLTLIPDPFGLP